MCFDYTRRMSQSTLPTTTTTSSTSTRDLTLPAIMLGFGLFGFYPSYKFKTERKKKEMATRLREGWYGNKRYVPHGSGLHGKYPVDCNKLLLPSLKFSAVCGDRVTCFQWYLLGRSSGGPD
jgi:hypothetical protein